jgi:hypothetical protein
MDDRVLAAVRNNASWCDAVCRSRGLPTFSSDRLWIAPDGSPLLYPDAITLAPRLAADEVLSGVRLRAGCSVKDSFADLDLGAHGFVEVFEANWVFRAPASVRARPRLRWAVITTEDELTRWSVAAELEDTFGPRLLRDPAVRFLAVNDDRGAGGGAIVNRTGPVLGVSNVFTAGVSLEVMWSDLPRAVAELLDRLPLVGYEHAGQLAFAEAAGFAAIAPLRVWSKPADPDRIQADH